MALVLCLVVAGWLRLDVAFSTRAFSVWQKVTPDWTERTRQFVRTQMDAVQMWPKPANPALGNFAVFDRLVAMHPPKTAHLEALSSGQTSGSAQVESWQPRRVVLRIEATRDSQLTLNHLYYAGWRGRIEGAATTLTAGASPNGLIQMDVPKGNYDLIIELPKDSAERAGTLISLVSLSAARRRGDLGRPFEEIGQVTHSDRLRLERPPGGIPMHVCGASGYYSRLLPSGPAVAASLT